VHQAFERFIEKFELTTITALQVLLVLSVAAGTIVLFVLFASGLYNDLAHLNSVEVLREALQRTFAGILIILLGLELLETLKAYFVHHELRVEVVLIVAMIAVSKYIIQYDLASIPARTVIGLAALTIALTVGYFLVKRAHRPRTADSSTDRGES
jgi:uncharacterized membrane protein (DUF373 family)